MYKSKEIYSNEDYVKPYIKHAKAMHHRKNIKTKLLLQIRLNEHKYKLNVI